MNREEVIKFIYDEFGVEGERLWAQFPNYVVFRNKRNRKWFALIGDVEKGKLGLDGEGKTDVMVLKCDSILIGSLIHNEGYLPAYHMNKKTWISVLLEGKAPDEQIKDLIHLAFDIIDGKK